MDGTSIPMVIIQNKVDKIKDLTDLPDFMKIETLKDFSKKNKFEMCYQTSAKSGENIEESITSFIKMVIDKLEIYTKNKNPDIKEDSVNINKVKLSNQKNSKNSPNVNNKMCCN
jgi:hypothetical protein